MSEKHLAIALEFQWTQQIEINLQRQAPKKWVYIPMKAFDSQIKLF